ncbi:DUF4265 domain-containing protein [Gammaproteobacteria bacterium]|nr:DUF4265 domain-containing protein [Gammaproteobacteria bacterium]
MWKSNFADYAKRPLQNTYLLQNIMTETEEIKTGLVQLVAGSDSQGMPVLEKLKVSYLETPGHYKLQRSPLFVRDLAAGDIFSCAQDNPANYKVIERSGNLSIRVFRKDDIDEVAEFLTPEVEKLDGSIDLKSDRALVYSLHVNNGFAEIERLFDSAMARYTDSVWYYGNVYDRNDGITPLNWWDEFINQV